MASGKNKESKSKKPEVSTSQHWILMGMLKVAILSSLWALFQWMELLLFQAGSSPFCEVGDTLSCGTVWASDFAKQLHESSGMPVAAWGLVWALAATGLSGLLVSDRLRGRSIDSTLLATRVLAVGGVCVTLGLAGVSLSIGTFCPTCLATYVLTIGFAVLAFKLRPAAPLSKVTFQKPALLLVWVLVVPTLLLFYPASLTPVESDLELGLEKPVATTGSSSTGSSEKPDSEPAGAQGSLQSYLTSLPAPALQAVSDGVDSLRRSAVAKRDGVAPRTLEGSPDAPVQLVTFSDMRCGHCKHLHETIEQLAQFMPQGSFGVEERFYPLDTDCNSEMPADAKDKTGGRCAAAKALVCLDGHGDHAKVRKRMFSEQSQLTAEHVDAILGDVLGSGAPVIKQCMSSSETTAKLAQDVAYVSQFDVHGTPIVLVNGRMGNPAPPFLAAMIIAEGDFEHAAFQKLPPPRPPHRH